MDTTTETSRASEAPHKGGLLIVTLPGQGATGFAHTDHAQYFAPSVNAGRVRDALVHWMQIWGISLTRSVSRPSLLERKTHEVVWCDEVPEKLHGPQTIAYYAANASRVLEALSVYEPRVVIIFSAYLYEALASESVAGHVVKSLGRAKGPARRITQERLKALWQPFERADVLVLPTPSKNTTDAYVATLSAPVREVFMRAGFDLGEAPETLLQPAKECLVLDIKQTLARLMNQFRIDETRALGILKALEEEGVISRVDEKGRRYVRLK